MMSKCTRWHMCDSRWDIRRRKVTGVTLLMLACNESLMNSRHCKTPTSPSVQILELLLSFCVQWLLPCKDSLPWYYKYPPVYTTAYPATKRQPGWLIKEEDWLTYLLLLHTISLYLNVISDFVRMWCQRAATQEPNATESSKLHGSAKVVNGRKEQRLLCVCRESGGGIYRSVYEWGMRKKTKWG